jgi:hypothetical protein
MALADVEGAIGGDSGDLVVRRDLTEELGQHRGIADVAVGELCRPDLQCFLVDPDVDLAPDAAFGAAMLACSADCLLIRLTPLAFTRDPDVRNPV